MTFGFRRDFVRRAFGDFHAVIQNGDALANAHDHLHVVFHQQNGNLKFVLDELDQPHQIRFFVGFMPAAGSSSSSSFGRAASARTISSRRWSP